MQIVDPRYSALARAAGMRPSFTRRALLKAGSALALAAALPMRLARATAPPADRADDVASVLTQAERRFVEAAVNTFIPADDVGPGGLDAKVPRFIERQLAGPFGRAEDWYMQGPFETGTPEQGYQLEATPLVLYRRCIAAIDASVQGTDSTAFADLTSARRDAVLKALGTGSMDDDVPDGATFVSMLHANTMEGFFADPIYGGNADHAGWKTIGYPGVRYDWRPWIGRRDRLSELPIVSIRSQVNPARS